MILKLQYRSCGNKADSRYVSRVLPAHLRDYPASGWRKMEVIRRGREK